MPILRYTILLEYNVTSRHSVILYLCTYNKYVIVEVTIQKHCCVYYHIHIIIYKAREYMATKWKLLQKNLENFCHNEIDIRV